MVIELAKKPYVCEQASPLSSEKEAKQALEAAGVVQRNESDVAGATERAAGSVGSSAALAQLVAPTNAAGYRFTDLGKQYVQKIDHGILGSWDELCWAKTSLDKIVKWEGPLKLGDYQEVLVTYTYQLTDIADWAKKPDVQAAFPMIKTTMEGAGSKEGKLRLKLTSVGWEGAQR